jgi:hypothetical protein
MTDLLRKSAYIHDRTGGVPTDNEIVYESLGGGRYIYWCSGGRGVAEAIKRHAEKTGSSAAITHPAFTRGLASENLGNCPEELIPDPVSGLSITLNLSAMTIKHNAVCERCGGPDRIRGHQLCRLYWMEGLESVIRQGEVPGLPDQRGVEA